MNNENRTLDLGGIRMVQQQNQEAYQQSRRIQREFYDRSIQDKRNSKRKKIHGKTYAKQSAKPYMVAAVSIAMSLIALKGIEVGEELSQYDTMLSQKMESELTKDQIAAYQKDQKDENFILRQIDKYEQISESKKSLDNTNYNILGGNVSNSKKEYIPYDEDSFINLSEKQQDAIDIATDQVIDEYRSRGR